MAAAMHCRINSRHGRSSTEGEGAAPHDMQQHHSTKSGGTSSLAKFTIRCILGVTADEESGKEEEVSRFHTKPAKNLDLRDGPLPENPPVEKTSRSAFVAAHLDAQPPRGTSCFPEPLNGSQKVACWLQSTKICHGEWCNCIPHACSSSL